MRPQFGNHRCRAVLVAGGLVLLAAASAQARDIRVATYSPGTGQFVVDPSVLKPTFADGTKIDEFAVRRFAGSETFVLIRRGSSAPGQCRTQATPVIVYENAAWVRSDALPHIVLLCATPIDQYCDSCRFGQALGGWECLCYHDGASTGYACTSYGQLVDNDPFILDWIWA